MRKPSTTSKKSHVDRRLLLIVLILLFVGLVYIANASAPTAVTVFDDKYYFVKQQIVWVAIGLVAFFVATRIHYKFWGKIATPFFWLAVLLLILVLIPAAGSKIGGARRWLVLGSVSIQPSEIAKLALVFYLAKLSVNGKKVAPYLISLGIVASLVILQPDLGTALVILAIGMSQIFVAGVNIVYLGGAAFIGAVASLALVLFSGYRKARLMTFLEQTTDPLGQAYHIRQILFALGSGGIFGVGLGRSRQKYLFLPEAATDSIFAIIAEELGFLGASVLIVLFAALIYYSFKVASNAPDEFSKILSVGVVVWITTHVFLNIGSMVALVPITGIPLPYLSYGGSSLLTILFATGILLNISRYAKASK